MCGTTDVLFSGVMKREERVLRSARDQMLEVSCKELGLTARNNATFILRDRVPLDFRSSSETNVRKFICGSMPYFSLSVVARGWTSK